MLFSVLVLYANNVGYDRTCTCAKGSRTWFNDVIFTLPYLHRFPLSLAVYDAEYHQPIV